MFVVCNVREYRYFNNTFNCLVFLNKVENVIKEYKDAKGQKEIAK